MLFIVLIVIIQEVKKIKNTETSPERVSRLKNQRERKNISNQNKLKNLQDLIPIIIDKEETYTKKRKNNNLDLNSPVKKKCKLDSTGSLQCNVPL